MDNNGTVVATMAGTTYKNGHPFTKSDKKVPISLLQHSGLKGIDERVANGHTRLRILESNNLPKGSRLIFSLASADTRSVITTAKSLEDTARHVVTSLALEIIKLGGSPFLSHNTILVNSVDRDEIRRMDAHKRLTRGLNRLARSQEYLLRPNNTDDNSTRFISNVPDFRIGYVWRSAMVGMWNPNKIISGNSLGIGQSIMAIQCPMSYSGSDIITDYFRNIYGECWWSNPDARKDIEEAAEAPPLTDYFLTTLHGWHNKNFQPKIKIHAIANLADGGIQQRFAKEILFPRSLCAELKNLPEPSQVLKDYVAYSGTDDETAYRLLVPGTSILVVIDKADEGIFLNYAELFNLKAKRAGQIVTSQASPWVSVRSGFSGQDFVIGG